MTRSELRTGMWVKHRNGEMSIVLKDTQNGDILAGQVWYPIDSIKEDLMSEYSMREFDIIEVYQPESNRAYVLKENAFDTDGKELIWQRQS